MNKRIDNLEFKLNDSKRSPEIVCWVPHPSGDPKEYCFTIVFYEVSKEGYEVKFIGDRPFSCEIDRKTFWKLLEYGQQICNANFKLMQQD